MTYNVFGGTLNLAQPCSTSASNRNLVHFGPATWEITTSDCFLQWHTHTTVLRLCGICPGQPGWAGTRKNIHPLSHRGHQSMKQQKCLHIH